MQASFFVLQKHKIMENLLSSFFARFQHWAVT